jgi:hypothetical protein
MFPQGDATFKDHVLAVHFAGQSSNSTRLAHQGIVTDRMPHNEILARPNFASPHHRYKTQIAPEPHIKFADWRDFTKYVEFSPHVAETQPTFKEEPNATMPFVAAK